MAQLTIHINAKPYVVGCEDGEEARLEALARTIDAKVREAGADGGQLGETRLMLLAALVLADELETARGSLAALEARVVSLGQEADRADSRAVAALEAAAQRIEAMAGRQGAAASEG